MVGIDAFPRAQKPTGLAAVMAIGTAVPPNCVDQSTYPDYYFRVTNSEDKTVLKEKFRRICQSSTVRQRYMTLTEELLKNNPSMCEYEVPSLNSRQDIVIDALPKLAGEAAVNAIKEWGQPKSKITHLIFCTTSSGDMPGADFRLVELLGLELSVKRYMLYQQGCFGGGTLLRLAKDLAENNMNARVLVVCCEILPVAFRGPSEDNMDILLSMALFGDGAAALIVGADPVLGLEVPVFEIASSSQTIVSGTGDAIIGHLREEGLTFSLIKHVPRIISENIEKCLQEAVKPLGITDWNSLFWIVHPGGPAILNKVETALGLKPEKLRASRDMLSEYGNLSSGTVLFILDEIRKKSFERGLQTTGEGFEWGVLFGFGPGLTVDTVILRSVPTQGSFLLSDGKDNDDEVGKKEANGNHDVMEVIDFHSIEAST